MPDDEPKRYIVMKKVMAISAAEALAKENSTPITSV